MEFTNGEFYQRLLANLKVLSMLKSGDKISVHEHVLQIESRKSMIPEFIRRFIFSQTRRRTLSSITDIVQQCENVTQLLKTSVDESLRSESNEKLRHLYQELTKAEEGLCHLMFTYKDDTSIGAELQVIIDRINIILKKVEEYVGPMSLLGE